MPGSRSSITEFDKDKQGVLFPGQSVNKTVFELLIGLTLLVVLLVFIMMLVELR